MNKAETNTPQSEIDPILMAVLANRLNAIVREMSNTLLRTARSAVLAVVRDFSCSIVTGDNRMLCPGEGLPVHIFGSSLQTQAMCDLHDDLAPPTVLVIGTGALLAVRASSHGVLPEPQR